MKIPLSWIKDYVEIELPIEELAHRLTMAGLEVEELIFVGLPLASGKVEIHSSGESRQETKISGLEWDADKIVVGAILEVMPHPNADRLVLCRLDDGQQVHMALTGAPNLFPYKGKGLLPEPIKVAFAREGARLYDGHQPGQVLMTLKRTKIRGVESYSMACSEKELGISDDHEGVIILDQDAPIGMPLVDYMGDVVLDIAITPNIARDANVIGVAREIAALSGKNLKFPDLESPMEGPAIDDQVNIEIKKPDLNPRFVLGLIKDIDIRPSPYEVQRRLHLAGMRPINNIVDATNYAMLEIGEPLHAFDHDILLERADGNTPTIITRTAKSGELLTTLDGVEHELDDFTVLVCDTAGPLSIGGVMGGVESEVHEGTRNVLLEGAAWNFTNIRRTLSSQNMNSEASYRFSRGVHPSLAESGVRRGLELMRQWSHGIVAQGLVDNYPLPPTDPTVKISGEDVERWLGIKLDTGEIVNILRRLEFSVQVEDGAIFAKTPNHRLDIGEGIIGVADLLEEIARVYGYDRIPETRMADELPPQKGNRSLEIEELLRDVLSNLGLQEVIAHRLTNPEKEALRFPQPSESELQPPISDELEYVRIANPITSDRNALRQSLVPGMLEIGERNSRNFERLAFFEIGQIFLPVQGQQLPVEPRRIAILLSGNRNLQHWQTNDNSVMDFYDLKGVITEMLHNIHLHEVKYEAIEHPTYHPGKCAAVIVGDESIGRFGEIHPLVKENYDLPDTPIMVADIDLELIQALVPDRYNMEPVSVYPPVLEDLAVVVDESVPAEDISKLIYKAGGKTITGVKLFDVYRGGQAGPGKKSLAFNVTYQDPDRTLTDQEVARIRKKIIKALEREIDAELRR